MTHPGTHPVAHPKTRTASPGRRLIGERDAALFCSRLHLCVMFPVNAVPLLFARCCAQSSTVRIALLRRHQLARVNRLLWDRLCEL